MKKITFLFLLSITSLVAQTPQNYLDVPTTGEENDNSGTAVVTPLQSSAQPIIDTYTDLTTFQNDIAAICQDTSLTFEDFLNGPSGVANCGPIISDAGDGCYSAGELQDGFNVTASNGTDLVAIPPPTIGNADFLVGAGAFAEFTIINFTSPVYAVAFDIWENNDPTTTIRIFDPSGNLINSYNATTPTNTQTFFGFISDEEVGTVEVEGNNDSGELFGSFYFGANCNSLSTQDILKSNFSFYPNPAGSSIQLNMPVGVELISVSAIDLLGKHSALNVSGNLVDISSLSKGIYILNVEASSGMVSKKLIKE